MSIITPNEYFDDIFCLNLNRRGDRWKTISSKFQREGMHVTRWTATDAESKEIRIDYRLLHSEKPQTNIKTITGYAILLSYIKLLYHIKSNSLKRVLIFEDDANFHINFAELFDKSVRSIPEDWEMWALGTSQYGTSNLEYTPDKMFFHPTLPNKNYGLFAFAIKDIYVPIVLKYLENRMYYADTRIYDHRYDNKSRVYISCPPICSHVNGWSDNRKTFRDETNVLEFCPCNHNNTKEKYW